MKPTKGEYQIRWGLYSTWNKKELCDHIGYLPQDIQLFGGEAFENITRFKEVDLEEFEKVCNDF